MRVAALFVASNGPYFDLHGVDPWDESRDARKYRGPYPVVAHPPCERWGKYWSGGPSSKTRKKLGDDGGCFASALASVRKWGGVLEHPAYSYAWKRFDLNEPPMDGGWVNADFLGGFTCHVEQGHYGHRARKATWLYAVSKHLPILKWGACGKTSRMDEGFHSSEERARARCRYQAEIEAYRARTNRDTQDVSKSARSHCRALAIGLSANEWLSRKHRMLTPPAFRDLLIEIARSAG